MTAHKQSEAESKYSRTGPNNPNNRGGTRPLQHPRTIARGVSLVAECNSRQFSCIRQAIDFGKGLGGWTLAERGRLAHVVNHGRVRRIAHLVAARVGTLALLHTQASNPALGGLRAQGFGLRA